MKVKTHNNQKVKGLKPHEVQQQRLVMTPTIEKGMRIKWAVTFKREYQNPFLPQTYMAVTPLKNATILAKHKQSQENENA